jgi:LAO/AO transport system kinase
VLDAAGYEVVMVETVGVGQDELDVTRTAHSTLVVMAPGLGDEVQAAKAGLLECADVFAVNKADREGADVTVGDLELMIALGHEGGRISSPRRPPAARSGAMTELAQARLTPTTESTDAGGKRTLGAAAEPVVAEGDGPPWTPPILKCVALRGEGVSAVVSALDGHARWSRETSAGRRRRRERLTDEVRDGLREALMEAAVEDLGARIDEAARDVESMVTDPYTATERLVAAFRSRSNPDQSTTPPLRGSLR